MAKRVLANTLSNCRRSVSRRIAHEQLFCDIPEGELDLFCSTDTYCLDCRIYNVLETEIAVHDIELADSLDRLSERKRNILLMYYYLEMSDAEI